MSVVRVEDVVNYAMLLSVVFLLVTIFKSLGVHRLKIKSLLNGYWRMVSRITIKIAFLVSHCQSV
jgi:hypothetical protein